MNIFKTTEPDIDYLAETIKEIVNTNAVSLNMLERAHRRNFNAIWFNDRFSPQEIIDSFGTDVKDLFIASKATQDYIKAFNPEYEYLIPPRAFTINEDGTVTIGELL